MHLGASVFLADGLVESVEFRLHHARVAGTVLHALDVAYIVKRVQLTSETISWFGIGVCM